MKPLYFFLALALVFSACSGDTAQNNNANTSETTGHEGHNHDGHDHAGHDHGTHVASSHISPYIGMWMIEFAIGVGDNKDVYEKTYKGVWYDFKSDNTFTSGRWEEQTGAGKWDVNKSTKDLTLDYTDDEKDIQWRTQGNSETLILLGNVGKNNSGTQVKMIRTNDRPKNN